MMECVIGAEIMAADIFDLTAEVGKVLLAGADMLHVEIDLERVELGSALGFMVCKKLRQLSVMAPISVNARGDLSDDMIETLANLSVHSVSVDPEKITNLSHTLLRIKTSGCQPGLTLTSRSSLASYLDNLNQIDHLIVARANDDPDVAVQQQFETLEKARSVIDKAGHDLRLGVTEVQEGSIAEFAKAGADTFIVSDAIFEEDDYYRVIAKLRKAAFAGIGARDLPTDV